MSVNGKRKTENGKRKTENGKRKTGSGKVLGVFGLLGVFGVFRLLGLLGLLRVLSLPCHPEFSVFRFHFSVRSSQRLYVVYNGIRAVQQVLAQFLEELLAGTGLYM